MGPTATRACEFTPTDANHMSVSRLSIRGVAARGRIVYRDGSDLEMVVPLSSRSRRALCACGFIVSKRKRSLLSSDAVCTGGALQGNGGCFTPSARSASFCSPVASPPPVLAAQIPDGPDGPRRLGAHHVAMVRLDGRCAHHGAGTRAHSVPHKLCVVARERPGEVDAVRRELWVRRAAGEGVDGRDARSP